MAYCSMKGMTTVVLIRIGMLIAASYFPIYANAEGVGNANGTIFPAYQSSSLSGSELINPQELVKVLQSSKGEKPLIIQVGFHVLYTQAHIPGSEHIGPASGESGLQQLRKRVEALPRNKFIVIYCGCCPWTHCPNVKPANDTLRGLGFTSIKVLYIPDNFGANWVDQGYPVAKGD
jgi:thiosulfate/3-mercaptopyruvate sulfurtransferase